MFENLKTRFTIIILILGVAIYFILPTLKLYNSKFDNNEQKKILEKHSIGLGLDLKGGLRITLELDEKIFLKRLVKKNLSQQSKNSLDNILDKASMNANNNNTDIIKEFIKEINQQKINLNKFYSNLSKSSNNNDILEKIDEQKLLKVCTRMVI